MYAISIFFQLYLLTNICVMCDIQLQMYKTIIQS